MKNILLTVVVALLAGGVFLGISSCKPDLEDKVVDAVDENGILSEADYQTLAKEYADEYGDTTGYYDFVVDIFNKKGFDAANIGKSLTKANLPQKVTVYLDNTSSMLGYMKPNNPNILTTDFTDLFSSVIGRYYQGKDIDAVYVNQPQKGKGASLVHTTYDNMCSMLTNKSIKAGDAFTMDALLDSVVSTAVNDTTHTSIAFIITDGILSGTNAEIVKDREFNRNNANELSRRISNVMNKAASNNYAVAIFKMNAKFDGKYYKYNNETVILKDATRPFYLIAVGDRDLVSDFAKNGRGNFPDCVEEMIMVSRTGNLVPGITGATINQKAEDDGNGKNIDCLEIMPLESSVRMDKASISLSYPLDRFPEYMRDLDVLRKALKVEVGGKDISPDSYKIEGSTLLIPVKIESGATEVVKIELNDALPEWVVNTTSSNDSNVEDAVGITQTFLLSEFVSGIKNGIYLLKTPKLGETEFKIDWSSGKTN